MNAYERLCRYLPRLAWGGDEKPRSEQPLFVHVSSFPPYVFELMERDYPNRLVAASCNPEAILAAERLYRAGGKP